MTQRIVSLLASGTEVVHALGLEHRLVGISHECDYPPEVLDRPRVSRPRFDPDGLTSGEIDRAVRAAMERYGSVYAVDDGLLAELEPDLILTQAVCEVCAVPTPGVTETVRRLGLGARVLSLDAHTLADILGTVEQVGAAAHVPERGVDCVSGLRNRLAAVQAALSDVEPRSVLAIEWLDPPFAPGHWVPEMIERAGGRCVAGRTGERSVQTDWAALEDLDPDVLVVMPCGYGLDASTEEADRHAPELARVAPRAVAERLAYVVDGSSYFNRSGPRAVDGVEILAGLLHPERWPAPTAEAARGWVPPRSGALAETRVQPDLRTAR